MTQVGAHNIENFFKRFFNNAPAINGFKGENVDRR